MSIDTTRAPVARACVAAGARMVNDVSGGLADPSMLATVAELDVDYVAMHWRAQSAQMDAFTHYTDVVEDVCSALEERFAACIEAGIAADRVILDPGLGFAKQAHHNWELLAGLPRLVGIGPRVLIGASRKRSSALCSRRTRWRGPRRSAMATAAVSALAATRGVWGVRVHDVLGSCDAVKVAAAWREAT